VALSFPRCSSKYCVQLLVSPGLWWVVVSHPSPVVVCTLFVIQLFTRKFVLFGCGIWQAGNLGRPSDQLPGQTTAAAWANRSCWQLTDGGRQTEAVLCLLSSDILYPVYDFWWCFSELQPSVPRSFSGNGKQYRNRQAFLPLGTASPGDALSQTMKQGSCHQLAARHSFWLWSHQMNIAGW